jgi:hypothetical protein
MRRMLLAAVFAATAGLAQPHFVYVVPTPTGAATVVFSDDLEPDENVPVAKIAGLKLQARTADGKDTAVECKVEKHHLTATAPAGAVLHGSVTYGLTTKAGAKPSLLVYHPKAVPAGVANAVVGAAAEAVPVTEAGKTRFRLLVAGKPVADAEGSVTLPDGTKQKVKTDAEGFTEGFAVTGRYAVWLRHTEAKAGDHDGKKYEDVKHYATLVFDRN